MGHNLCKRGQRECAAALHQTGRSLGDCCIGPALSRKACPERGDAAELVPLTRHGILDRFGCAAGLCHEENNSLLRKKFQ